ncbi:MAG: AAA family ATPase [Candidatus Aenigmarchaeota archaeon]|nr:AAA family ATPase [Candidatus Aenigmarchaeota archaeon]
MFRWKENPFTFKIIPELFVGYEEQWRGMLASMESGSKFSLVIGPTGSGKTTLLRFLEAKTNGRIVRYLPKPPRNAEEWVGVFKEIARPKISLFGNGINIYNLHEKVNARLEGARCYIFIDECHEAAQEGLEWMRTLTDQVHNLCIVMAGLPVFEEKMKASIETLQRRVGHRTALANLTKYEAREMVKRRIEHCGGDDIRPFTQEAMDYVYERTAGFPRDVINLCNQLVLKAIERSISTIDMNFISAIESPVAKPADALARLPKKQLLLLDMLSEAELTPVEMAGRMEGEEYKTRGNAIRAANNLLNRLMSAGLVERKSIGKSYRYCLSPLAKTLLVKA